jgi:hypothetical protein
MIRSFVNQICKFKSFERRLIHFEIQGKFERNYSIAWSDLFFFFKCKFFHVEIHTYSGLSWSSTWQLDCKKQLMMGVACHFECDLHPPEIHCTILQSATWCLIQVFVGESTAVRNKMLDPSVCWRIDRWTRSMCEWSSFQSVHDSPARVMVNMC